MLKKCDFVPGLTWPNSTKRYWNTDKIYHERSGVKEMLYRNNLKPYFIDQKWNCYTERLTEEKNWNFSFQGSG